MYKISIYGCAMFKKLVCQWVKTLRFLYICSHKWHRFHTAGRICE